MNWFWKKKSILKTSISAVPSYTLINATIPSTFEAAAVQYPLHGPAREQIDSCTSISLQPNPD